MGCRVIGISSRWRLPIAGLIAGLVIALGADALVGQVDENSETIQRLDRQDRRIEQNLRALRRLERIETQGRGAVVRIFCVADNDERGKLRELLIDGARSSAIFEPLFEAYGAPPLETRLRKARRDAGDLAALDCDELVRIARQGPAWSRRNP